MPENERPRLLDALANLQPDLAYLMCLKAMAVVNQALGMAVVDFDSPLAELDEAIKSEFARMASGVKPWP